MQTLTIAKRSTTFYWGTRTYIMGVLNVTPDSFSDGGQFHRVDAAIDRATSMVAAGVDIIDVGGESAKPGAIPVDEQTELERVIPVIRGIRNHPETQDIPISIDTSKAGVARLAIEAGADIVNDVSGGKHDPQMLSTVGRLGVPYLMMHMRGTPSTMQQMTDYQDVVGEILAFFESQIQTAIDCGIDRSHIIIDPGIGFAKTSAQNIELIRQLDRFKVLDLPLLVGVSRKSFIGKILSQPEPNRRVWGTSAAICAAIAGGADLVRVHDVAEMVEVCRVADVLWRERVGSRG